MVVEATDARPPTTWCMCARKVKFGTEMVTRVRNQNGVHLHNNLILNIQTESNYDFYFLNANLVRYIRNDPLHNPPITMRISRVRVTERALISLKRNRLAKCLNEQGNPALYPRCKCTEPSRAAVGGTYFTRLFLIYSMSRP